MKKIGGDSLKYLQVITAHALIMIFFVVVPIFFWRNQFRHIR